MLGPQLPTLEKGSLGGHAADVPDLQDGVPFGVSGKGAGEGGAEGEDGEEDGLELHGCWCCSWTCCSGMVTISQVEQEQRTAYSYRYILPFLYPCLYNR
jgi:hypothetical protein